MGHVLDEKLTDKQARFVAHYLTNGFNATKAAIAAGYKKARARQMGAENLSKRYIRENIDSRMAEAGITAERVQRALAEMAFANDVADFEPYLQGGMSLEAMRDAGLNTALIRKVKVKSRILPGEEAETEIDREIELYSRDSALDKLSKILGIYIERRELDVRNRVEGGLSEEELCRRAHCLRRPLDELPGQPDPK